jgi:hypothetical protein
MGLLLRTCPECRPILFGMGVIARCDQRRLAFRPRDGGAVLAGWGRAGFRQQGGWRLGRRFGLADGQILPLTVLHRLGIGGDHRFPQGGAQGTASR